MSSKNGTDGRIYGGDCNLIHVQDGMRELAGTQMALLLTRHMRKNARGVSAWEQEYNDLCPGCYMIVGYNMLIALADQNGQSRKELGASMAKVFRALADGVEFNREEIEVILDPEEAA